MAVSSHISPLDVMRVKERQTGSELKALLRFTSSQRALRGEKMASVTYLKWSDYFHTNTNTLLLSYTLTAPVSPYWLFLLCYRPCASNLDRNQVCIALQREIILLSSTLAAYIRDFLVEIRYLDQDLSSQIPAGPPLLSHTLLGFPRPWREGGPKLGIVGAYGI